MLKKTAPTESMPATRQALSSSRWLWRAGAALVLALALGLLYWGGFEQAPRQHPFHAPDFAGWLLEPMPHPSYGEMPVVPAGTAGDVSTRGLCAGPDDACGGIEITDDGRALIRFEGTAELLARVRHVREDGHLFAVSAKGRRLAADAGRPADLAARRASCRSGRLQPQGPSHRPAGAAADLRRSFPSQCGAVRPRWSAPRHGVRRSRGAAVEFGHRRAARHPGGP